MERDTIFENQNTDTDGRSHIAVKSDSAQSSVNVEKLTTSSCDTDIASKPSGIDVTYFIHNENTIHVKGQSTTTARESINSESPTTSWRESGVPCIESNEEEEVVLYGWRWIVLIIFSLISMTNAAMWISLSSISSIVKEYYHVSFASANWLAMIFSTTYLFVVPAVYILNKFGLKSTIIVGAVLNALGGCLKLIGSGRKAFILAITGNGFGGLAQCFILFAPPTLAATWFGEKERGIASAIGMLMNMLGVSLGFIMSGMIVPRSNDYEGVVKAGLFKLLLSQGVFSAILAFLSVIFIKNAPPSPPSMSQVLLQERKWEKKMNKKIRNDIELRYYYVSNETSAKKSVIYKSCEANTFNMDEFLVGFRKSFSLLWRNKGFHLVMQSYGIFFGLYLAINTLLNHICTMKFPGKEKDIGIMGSASVIFGLLGMLLGGIWIDKTHRYKLISVVDFISCAVTLLAFTLLSEFNGNFKVVFASFCAFGFVSYPYMSVGLEHAAEVAFPVSEGVTSGILLFVGNTYGIILTFVINTVLDIGGTSVAGYVAVFFYLVGTIIVASTNAELKRLKADRNGRSTSVQENINGTNS